MRRIICKAMCYHWKVFLGNKFCPTEQQSTVRLRIYIWMHTRVRNDLGSKMIKT